MSVFRFVFTELTECILIIYKRDTTFPNPDYHSETDVEIAFVKEDVEVYHFSHLAEGIDCLQSDSEFAILRPTGQR